MYSVILPPPTSPPSITSIHFGLCCRWCFIWIHLDFVVSTQHIARAFPIPNYARIIRLEVTLYAAQAKLEHCMKFCRAIFRHWMHAPVSWADRDGGERRERTCSRFLEINQIRSTSIVLGMNTIKCTTKLEMHKKSTKCIVIDWPSILPMMNKCNLDISGNKRLRLECHVYATTTTTTQVEKQQEVKTQKS